MMDPETSTEQDLGRLETEIRAAAAELKATMATHEETVAELSEKAAAKTADQITEVEARLAALMDKQAGEVEALKEQMDQRGVDTAELAKTNGELAAAVKDLRAKAQRPSYGGGDLRLASESFAERAINNPEFMAALATKGANQRGVFAAMEFATNVERKEELLTTTPTGPDRWAPFMRLAPVAPPSRPLTLRSVMQAIPSDRKFDYLELTTAGGAIPTPGTVDYTGAAAFTAEGTALAEASYRWELREGRCKQLGQYVTVSETALDSIPMLRMELDVLQNKALALVEENQILSGDGIGENLGGILPAAGTALVWSAQPAGTTKLDLIRKGITAARVLYFAPTAVILNPGDLESLDLTKATDDQYIFSVGGPTGTGPSVWRLPVIESTVIPLGTALIGDFGIGAWIMDWQRVRIEVSNSHDDTFIRGMLTIRAIEHVGLAIRFANAFVELTFDSAPV